MAGGLTEGCVARIEGLPVMASTALLDGQGRLYAWLCTLGGQGWPWDSWEAAWLVGRETCRRGHLGTVT